MICVALGAALRMRTAACELTATQAGETPGLGPPTRAALSSPGKGQGKQAREVL